MPNGETLFNITGLHFRSANWKQGNLSSKKKS